MVDVLQLRSQCQDKYQVLTSKDGTQLFLRDWTVNMTSKTAIVIFHGITAYSKPYSPLGKAIAGLGFACFGFDLRGHGLSDGIRGDYPSLKILLDDLSCCIEYLKGKYEKVVVVGHSLGVVTSIITSNHNGIDGLCLLSAARRVKFGAYPTVPFTTKIKALVSSIIRPSKPVVHYWREGIQGQDDPLFNFYYTLRFLRILSAANVYIPSKYDYPVFMAVGDRDELFDIESAKALFDEIPANNKEFAVMKDTSHAGFNNHSFDDLCDFLKKNYN